VLASGQSIFGFACRIAGTVGAMIVSYIAWYIVDGHAAGVIVFTWLFNFIGFYCLIKWPRLIASWITIIITQVLIIGYELQVEKIGQAAAEATGQVYYP
jgi:hypothetical protein